MPRGCKVCRHENVKEINKAIIEGATLQSLADKYGLHISSLSRHKPHIADVIRSASVICDAQEGASVLQRIDDLLQRANLLLDKAEDSGDVKTALIAIREVRGTLELLGKASGQLAPEKILIQVEPVINTLIMILKQEIQDPVTIQRISERMATIDI
jgi:hypothetical protein